MPVNLLNSLYPPVVEDNTGGPSAIPAQRNDSIREEDTSSYDAGARNPGLILLPN